MASAPAVRASCENCYRRKQKCVFSSRTAKACVHCHSVGAACLFAPRSKPGRVPRQSPTGSNAVNDRNDVGSPPWTADTTGSSNGLFSFSEDCASVTAEGPLETASSSELMRNAPEMAWGYTDVFSSGPSFTPTDSTIMPAFTRQNSVGTMSAGGGLPSPALSMNHNSTTSLAARSKTRIAPITEDFQALLETCRQLDQLSESQRSHDGYSSDDESTINALTAFCAAAARHSPEMSPSKGSTATLALAAMLKALDVAEGLVERVGRRQRRTSSGIEDMFLLKQLDILLLQARICFAHGQQEAGVQKADQVHQMIKSTVNREFAMWSWDEQG